MPFGLGIWEIVALLAVLALLFGTKGVPKMARKLGTSVRELKDSVAEIDPRTMFDDDDARTDKPRHDAPAQPAQRSLPPAPPQVAPPPSPQSPAAERDNL